MPRYDPAGMRLLDAGKKDGGAIPCCTQKHRWLCLAAGCAMQVCAGAVYSFGSIAEDLKRNLELKDAHEQGLISISGNLGLWVGSFTGGLLADKRGPRCNDTINPCWTNQEPECLG